MELEALRAIRVLTDPDRLAVCAALRTTASTAEGLARVTGISPRGLSRHLSLLEAEGLVTRVPPSGSGGRESPPAPRFRLAVDRLAQLGQEVDRMVRQREAGGPGEGADPSSMTLAGVAPEAEAGAEPPTAEAMRVLRAFIVDGRLASIPAQHRKRLAVLRHLVERVFAEPRPYLEREVNQRLAVLHPDVASLRRYLVDEGYMSRDAGVYQLRPRTEWPPPDASD